MVSQSAWRGRSSIACAAIVLHVAGVAGTAHAGVITVDDFSESPQAWPITLNVVGFAQSVENAVGGVLGGRRQVDLAAKSLNVPTLDNVAIAIAPSAGIFDYASSAGANGSFSLLYNGGGDLNADLSGLSAFGIEIVLFDFANSAPLPVTITLDDGANAASRTEVINSAGAQTLTMGFAGFAGIGSLDLTSINSILIEFDPGLGNDLRIGPITVVPAPAGLAVLAGMGLIGVRRRRRRHG